MNGGRPAHAAMLEYAGRRFGVSSNRPETIEWLLEVLGPDYRWTPGQADVAVEVLFDDGAYRERAGRQRAGTPASVDLFTLDGRSQQAQTVPGVEGAACFFDPRYQLFYDLAQAGGAHLRIVAPARRPEARLGLLKAVRELSSAAVFASGGAVLHAAALGLGDAAGGGVLVIGSKKAGKTTLLTQLLRRPRTRFVANDRVCVWPDAARGVRARGLTTAISLRPWTAGAVPGLEAALGASGFHHALMARECSASKPARLRASGPVVSVSAAQLCTLLGVRRAGEVRAATVLMPRVVPGLRGLSTAEVPRAEGAERLYEAILRGAGGVPVTAPFALGEAGACPPARELRRRCAALAGALRFITCSLGEGAFEEPSALDRLVESIRSA